MQINDSTIRNWKKYLDHGDIGLISEESGISRQTISLAFNEGLANTTTIKAIKKFIDKKKAQEILFGKVSSGARQKIEKLRNKMCVLTRPPHNPTMYYLSEVMRIKDQLEHGELKIR